MRSANGFTNATTRALAAADAPVQVAATGPASLAGASYFTCDPNGAPQLPTTPTSAQWHNAVTEEIEAVLQLVGDTCDPTDNTQMSQMLTIAAGATAASADTGNVSNVMTRVKIACGNNASSTGAQSVAIGSSGLGGVPASFAEASGAHSAIEGNSCSTGAQIDASGAGARVIGCKTGGVGNDVTASGVNSTIIGCNTDFDAFAEEGPLLASGRGSFITGSVRATASGKHSSTIGTRGVTVSGSESFAHSAAANPGKTLTVSGALSGALATIVTDDCDVTEDCSLLVCSNSDVPAFAADGQMYGGSGGSRKIRIDFANGRFYASTAAYVPGGADDGSVDDSGAGTAGFNSNGADYAECFPLLVVGEALPARRLVTAIGGKVRIAQPGDRIRGAVSVAPAVLGDSPEDMSHAGRDEWCPVALVGKVDIEICAPAMPGDYLVAGPDGRGIPAAEPPRTGRPVEVDAILVPFDEATGYGVARCLVG